MACSRISTEELEDLRLSYDILSSVLLRAPGPEERADDLREGFVAIYEPAMQQGLRLPMHPFFREVLKDWNLAPCQITPNGWGQMVASLWEASNPEEESRGAEVEVGQTFRFKGVPVIRLARPTSGEDSSVQASRQEAQDVAPSSIVPPLRPEVDDNILSRPPSSSNLHINSIASRDKEKKARRTEEGCRSSPSLDGEPEGVRNPVSSAGQNHSIRISERCEELPASVMEMLPAHPSIVAASVHSAFASFDAEDSKSKKLVEDLKAMGLEKALLEFDKRVLQFKLDLVVSKETDMKKRADEAQSLAEEAQKLAEDLTLAAKTALAVANSSLEAAAVDNERSLSETKLELEKIKVEQADAEARAVEAYQDAFVDTPEYQDLAQRLVTLGREQLVERIMEVHPEWDLSFLHEAPVEAHVSEADPGDTRGRDEGPSCADP
ncbi:Uncharacterized protein Adt_11848 [Abeliophyllum distichum]|uniref:Transposase (putative) gypsy type domain-containing protein n=1 Tax=Abeliophyllum distichum TaxID=126358 RepID=A0ABD1UP25_9LAMI